VAVSSALLYIAAVCLILPCWKKVSGCPEFAGGHCPSGSWSGYWQRLGGWAYFVAIGVLERHRLVCWGYVSFII
jgi:hypothetical protein